MKGVIEIVILGHDSVVFAETRGLVLGAQRDLEVV